MTNGPTTDPASLSYLVVDDEAFSRDTIAACLRGLGVTAVATAASAADALALISQSAPDVMLVDLHMPEMGGAELLRRAAEGGYRGAAIIVSGLDDETRAIAEVFGRYHEVNVLGHVEKPLTAEVLKGLLAGLGN